MTWETKEGLRQLGLKFGALYVSDKRPVSLVISDRWLHGTKSCKASHHLAGMEPGSYNHNIEDDAWHGWPSLEAVEQIWSRAGPLSWALISTCDFRELINWLGILADKMPSLDQFSMNQFSQSSEYPCKVDYQVPLKPVAFASLIKNYITCTALISI
jgi:hypothetical protein